MITRKICLFGKEPVPGRVKTRLAAGIGETAAVEWYRSMLEITVQRVLDVPDVELEIWFDPPEAAEFFVNWLRPLADGPDRIRFRPQVNGDLGARLLATFEPDLPKKTLLVGSDCPGLLPRHLDLAFTALDNHDVVLGPSEDGGYYLIGATASHPTLFADMPWSTETLRTETLRRAAESGLRVHELSDVLRDVDTAEDLGL